MIPSLKMTTLRQTILELVTQHSGIIKAYDILAALNKSQHKLSPMQVYRVLDSFVQAGILHRVEAVNGFITCRHSQDCHPHDLQPCLILICRQCEQVKETHPENLVQDVAPLLNDHQFILDTQSPLVIMGHCINCQTASTHQ